MFLNYWHKNDFRFNSKNAVCCNINSMFLQPNKKECDLKSMIVQNVIIIYLFIIIYLCLADIFNMNLN